MLYKEIPRLSYVVPFYFDQGSVQPLYDLFSLYSSKQYADVMRYVQFVLVDDCSTEKIVLPSDLNLNITLYRITDNIRWNQPGAKNLGITMAPTSKILSTDIDHHIPVELLEMMIQAPDPYNQIYFFQRVKSSGEPCRVHLNTFFTSKAVFFKSLGFDEQFCGHYAMDDYAFVLLHEYLATELLLFDNPNVVTYEEYKKGNYHTLERDATINKALYKTIEESLQAGTDPLQCHSRLFLNFKWEKIV